MASAAALALAAAPQSKIVPFPEDGYANRACLHHVKQLPLKGAQKAVLLVQALHASLKDWTCTLAFPTIALEAGVCARTAKRAVLELEQGGYIEIVKHGVGRSANTYRVIRQQNTANTDEKPAARSSDMVSKNTAAQPRSSDIFSVSSKSQDQKTEDSLRPKSGAADEPTEYRKMFDAVARLIFQTDPEQLTVDGGRIGVIASWLCRKTDRVGKKHLGFISRAAQVEHVEAFARRWHSTYPNASLPRDLAKFIEHWRAFASAPVSTARGWTPAAVEPAVAIQVMTAEERAEAVSRAPGSLRASMAAAERAGR